AETQKLHSWLAATYPGLKKGTAAWNEMDAETAAILDENGWRADWNANGVSRNFEPRKLIVENAMARIEKRQQAQRAARVERELHDKRVPPPSVVRPGMYRDRSTDAASDVRALETQMANASPRDQQRLSVALLKARLSARLAKSPSSEVKHVRT